MMRHSEQFTISSTIQSYPKGPYKNMKDDILGPDYTLSLTFIGSTRATRLNREYRNKTYTPNVLSFPLSDTVGEIYICPEVAFKEAHEYDLSKTGYVHFLFIHGCLHLKGYRHGATMEGEEQKYRKAYRVS